eukprot:TRINITY_DN17352_c0_g2_i1.p1 TRINITY_DN17352_c0_g2~~TRINITY_DN17352_c0_g2_i1.p1  ORF type:complete len:192 (-),score=47.32 TRINITY_DN17352_c0_g2_i1:87-662(-)
MARGSIVLAALVLGVTSAAASDLQKPVAVQVVNATLGHTVANQLELELNLATVKKSKIALALISGSGFGCCGIDRCYLGQVGLGIAKGVTLGGIGIWAAIDGFIILVNMLEKSTELKCFGFNAEFDPNTVDMAFNVAVGLAILHALSSICGGAKKVSQSREKSRREAMASEAADELYPESSGSAEYMKLSA